MKINRTLFAYFFPAAFFFLAVWGVYKNTIAFEKCSDLRHRQTSPYIDKQSGLNATPIALTSGLTSLELRPLVYVYRKKKKKQFSISAADSFLRA